MNDKSLRDILIHLSEFIEGKIVSFSTNIRKDRIFFHYYTEIIRYWSKINFILTYTIRALNFTKEIEAATKSSFLYLIYRCFWESATFEELDEEFYHIYRDGEISLEQNLNIRFFDKLQTFSWKKALKNKNNLEKISIEKAIPSFFLERLLPYMKKDFIINNVEVMNNPEKVELGIFLIQNEDSSLENLVSNFKEFLVAKKIAFSHYVEIYPMFKISSNNISPILETDFYKQGNLIILDVGSANIVNLLSNGKDNSIMDMCAAPGIKSILIAKTIKGRNNLFAAEFSPTRTEKMHTLLNFLNINEISLLNTDSINFPLRKNFYFDKILLDAPCTGSGTFSTNPELKWRQNHEFLHQNITLQEKLLISAINRLKPQGMLIYSTCSLYAEEGELQIKRVMDKLIPLKLPDFFSPSYQIEGKLIQGTGRLFPAMQRTKGFFVGKFKKKG